MSDKPQYLKVVSGEIKSIIGNTYIYECTIDDSMYTGKIYVSLNGVPGVVPVEDVRLVTTKKGDVYA